MKQAGSIPTELFVLSELLLQQRDVIVDADPQRAHVMVSKPMGKKK